MAAVDYYAILGVSRQVAAEDLKKAYRRLAIHWHPDRNPGSRLAEERFKIIAEAYAVLSNAAKRRQYDNLGPAKFKNEYSREDIFQGFEPGDLFGLFGREEAEERFNRLFRQGPAAAEANLDPLNVFFADFGRKGLPRGKGPPDIIITLQATFREAALGADKTAAYNTPEGTVKVKVTIPAGSDNGHKIVLAGQAIHPDRSRGNLVVTLAVTPDPDYSRQGWDLITHLNLAAEDLTGGCRPLVQPLTGAPLRLTVPAGTRAGAIFKIPDRGLPRPEGGRGDLLVKIRA